ncbi:sugar-phosphate nucleotide transferase [Candidatus Omnitrophus magneticus]|uniref:Sugar-phosphate nucleotide transferase n=1 Tax=Candidatus Omnitrophus magneticus TaxID=1609969 RepID=A0A0F0CTQ7_9BACT|nr:sugar-phosphate nucleotide transferase [Candidatus Omnitrophus magneticus]
MINPSIKKETIVTKKDTVIECFKRLNETGFHMLICLEAEKFIGIITDYDIRRGILNGVKLEDSIEKIINYSPITLKEDISKPAALAFLKEKSIDAVPVVDKHGKFIDLYTVSELARSMARPNSAVIMAGGLGQRLGPMTKNTPKPLLKINDSPIIEHVIRHLADYGIESFFVTVNYKSDMLKKFLKDGSGLGVRIKYIEEKKPMGTIGALSLLTNNTFEFPFIVMNSDIMTRLNFSKLIEQHKTSGHMLTVCLTNYQYNVPYGVIEVSGDRIIGINEKPLYSFFINAGIYCMSPEIIKFIPKDKKYDVTMLMEQLISKNIPVGYYTIDEYWRDIGNFTDFSGVKNDINNGELTLKKRREK